MNIRKNFCVDCGKDVIRKHIQRCKNCYLQNKISEANAKRFSEMVNTEGGSTIRFNGIRRLARRVMELAGIAKQCKNCGWQEHVEACHIRPLSEFYRLDSLVGEANDLSNLIYLCPNCHWLFDNGKLDSAALV